MKVAVLYSGGKDSNYALYLAKKYEYEISCLISMKAKNKESYMFQTPGNDFISYQAEALGINLIHYETSGEKEIELNDMKDAIKEAIDKYAIEGIITGAIKSAYQAQRVQKICNELNIECFNPLWQIDEEEFMMDLIKDGFDVRIIGVFSYPLTEDLVGVYVTEKILEKLKEYNKKYQISVAGEGGEMESFVVDGPTFKKKLEIEEFEICKESENSILMNIKKIKLYEK